MDRRTFIALLGSAAIEQLAEAGIADCQALMVSPADADFAARAAAPGVVRVFGFNDASQLSKKRLTAPYDYSVKAETAAATSGNVNAPFIDRTTFASGSGSLRMDVPTNSGPDGGGDWFGEFSDDCSVLFGPATEPQQTPAGNKFYIQWAQRFSPEMFNVYYDTEGLPTGWKLAIITAGDIPPGWLATEFPAGHVYASCEKVEISLERYHAAPFFQAYNECNVYAGMNAKVAGGSDHWLQNAMPQHCLYTEAMETKGTNAPVPGCFNLVPNVWYTFQVGLTLGPRDRTTRRFTNSTFKMWAAVKGQPSTLLIDWNPSVLGYFPLCDGEIATPEWFGCIYLLPYMTRKSPLQVHPTASVWYDELIISKQRVPDPAA